MDIVLDFSGIYEGFEDLITGCGADLPEGGIRDLRNMTGVNGYCSDEAKRELKKIVSGSGPEGIHFIDNGNYHYMSSIFIQSIKVPFDLIVFDHHTDMQPPGLLPVLSCGSWVLDSIADAKEGRNLMRKAFVIGPPEPPLDEMAVCVTREKADREELISDLAAELFSQSDIPVYISIDKDVLHEEEIILNWDQGSMRTETLLYWLGEIFRLRPVIGMDVCGEPEYNTVRDKAVYDSLMWDIRILEFYRQSRIL